MSSVPRLHLRIVMNPVHPSFAISTIFSRARYVMFLPFTQSLFIPFSCVRRNCLMIKKGKNTIVPFAIVPSYICRSVLLACNLWLCFVANKLNCISVYTAIEPLPATTKNFSDQRLTMRSIQYERWGLFTWFAFSGTFPKLWHSAKEATIHVWKSAGWMLVQRLIGS